MSISRDYIPKITLNDATGEAWISGESYHEYTMEVFQHVYEWLNNQTRNRGQRITFNFRMTYFNTSSSRIFLEFMQALEDYQNQKGGQVKVNWYCDKQDIDMIESGERYIEDVQIPFDIIVE